MKIFAIMIVMIAGGLNASESISKVETTYGKFGTVTIARITAGLSVQMPGLKALMYYRADCLFCPGIEERRIELYELTPNENRKSKSIAVYSILADGTKRMSASDINKKRLNGLRFWEFFEDLKVIAAIKTIYPEFGE